jgi:hypothetical protein
MSEGVTELARALRAFQVEWRLDQIAATVKANGQRLTLRWTGELPVIESDDGHWQVLRKEALL